MLKTFILGKNKSKSTILTANVFSVAIIVAIFSTSCMAPRPHSHRGNRVEVVTKSPEVRDVERKKEVDSDSDGKLDPEEYIRLLDEAQAKNENQNPKIEQSPEPILKPLDQQVAYLEKRQDKTENDVKAINKKIEYLENSIARLNEAIDNLSSHLPPASVGPNEEIASNTIQENEPESAEFIIKSDEEIAKEKEIETPEETKKEEIEVKNDLIPDNVPQTEIDKLNELSFSLAEAYLEKNDYGKAIKKLQEIENRIEEVTGKSKVSMMLGESHFGLKQYAKAINYFIKVLEMPEFGTHDKARMMIADSHIAQGETDKAKNYYKDLVSENPKSNYIPKAKMMLQRL